MERMADPTISSASLITKTTPPKVNRGAQFFDSVAKTPAKNSLPDQQKAFEQASQSLPTNSKPRTDVPRGFYLNIVV